MDVALIHWPAEADRLSVARSSQQPRLVLVASGRPVPVNADCLEDWVRLPAPDDEVEVRAATLASRAQVHAAVRPSLDDGLVRFRGEAVALPPIEQRLVDALVQRYGSVVTRDGLARAGWPGGPPGRNALDVHMLRVRRKLAPLGLSIRTVRSRGYMLAASPGPGGVQESRQEGATDA